jgi:hypothetical protein
MRLLCPTGSHFNKPIISSASLLAEDLPQSSVACSGNKTSPNAFLEFLSSFLFIAAFNLETPFFLYSKDNA